MFGKVKRPNDTFPYVRSLNSRPLTIAESVGQYVFVVDIDETIHVAPDGSHMHPKVLGNGDSALYAGELTIDSPGNVEQITNLSGTFSFRSKSSLCCVADRLKALGFNVNDILWFPPEGSSNAILLVCQRGTCREKINRYT